MRRLLLGFAAVASLLSFTYAEGETKIHEAGRCAIRGHCGKQGFFGGNLPCPDNGLAKEPTDDVRKKLVALCGDKWSEGPVCCEDEQVRDSVYLLHCMKLTCANID
jgi:Niemann-Pick C1 protein